MADDESVVRAVALPPRDAIAYFRQKENVPTAHWTDLWNEAHARGFMVAGAASDALVKDLRAALDKRFSERATAKDFEKEFRSIVEKHGWKHTGSTGWRASIIYETNMATAFSAGRYRRMTTPESRAIFPYWRYTHHACQHPRPQHLAWDGMILRNDDPWWNTHYPPNGWRCHCTVEVVSEPMLARKGWEVSDSPPIEMRSWRNPHTGEVHQVPVGIDPGFGYNPGKAWADNEAARDGGVPSGVHIEDHGRAARPEPTGYVNQAPAPVVLHPMAPDPTHMRPDIARPSELPDSVRRQAQRSAVESIMRAPIGEAEVGTLPPDVQEALGAGSPHVRLSEQTIEKQNYRHPELTADDYTHLPDTIADAPVVAMQGEHRVVLFRRHGKLYRAAIKVTADKARNYLVSLHRTTPESAERALRGMTLLRGSLDDLIKNDAPDGPPGNPS